LTTTTRTEGGGERKKKKKLHKKNFSVYACIYLAPSPLFFLSPREFSTVIHSKNSSWSFGNQSKQA
jgi:hypothetical protein